MSVAGTYLLAILDGIADRWHSRAVPVAMLALVLGQALLDDADNLRLREKLVGASLYVSLGEAFGSPQRFLVI
jgi:hypothetical protein